MESEPAILSPSTKHLYDYGVFRNCVVPVNKPIASLTFEVISKMRNAMGARHYKIGHAGVVDVMASGLVLLLFGLATKRMVYYSSLEKEYEGVFRIGQETKTFDALSPVTMTQSWSHISTETVRHETRKMVGHTLQLIPSDYMPMITDKPTLCHLRYRPEKERNLRVMEVSRFDVSRTADGSSEFKFHVLCKSTVSINSLIHELGQKLHSGAHVRHSARLRIGHFTLSTHSWDLGELLDHTVHLRRTAYLKNYQLYDDIKNQFWRRLGPVSNKKRQRLRRRREYQRKIKRQIREGKRKPIMTALCY